MSSPLQPGPAKMSDGVRRVSLCRKFRNGCGRHENLDPSRFPIPVSGGGGIIYPQCKDLLIEDFGFATSLLSSFFAPTPLTSRSALRRLSHKGSSEMLSSCAVPNIRASARTHPFLGRGRSAGERSLLRNTVNVRRKSRFCGRTCLAVRADASSELEDGQIEGVRVARPVFLFQTRATNRTPSPRASSPPQIEGYGAISTKPVSQAFLVVCHRITV